MVEPPYLPESLVPVYFKGGRFAHPSIHTKKSPSQTLTTMRGEPHGLAPKDHQEEEREEIEASG